MIGQLGWEKIDLTELSNIWRLCSHNELVPLMVHSLILGSSGKNNCLPPEDERRGS